MGKKNITKSPKNRKADPVKKPASAISASGKGKKAAKKAPAGKPKNPRKSQKKSTKNPEPASSGDTKERVSAEPGAAGKLPDLPNTPDAQDKKGRGRPSKYTEALADEICKRISGGETLRSICRDEHMPTWHAVYDWKNSNEEFSRRIARAREAGYDAIAESCFEIADDSSQDTMLGRSGEEIPDKEWILRSKLRVETRLKLLSKWAPKKYGEKLALAGDEDSPVNVNQTTKIVMLPPKETAVVEIRPIPKETEQ